MKTSLLKYAAGVLFLLGLIYVYNLPAVSTWRYHNNAVREFDAKNFEKAKELFRKASDSSDDYVHLYNWVVTAWISLEEKYKASSDTLKSNQIKDEIDECHSVIDELASRSDLPEKIIAKIHYVQGRLHLLENEFTRAKTSFETSITIENEFKPSLLELVKIENMNKGAEEKRPETELLLALTEVDNIIVIKDYKPF